MPYVVIFAIELNYWTAVFRILQARSITKMRLMVLVLPASTRWVNCEICNLISGGKAAFTKLDFFSGSLYKYN